MSKAQDRLYSSKWGIFNHFLYKGESSQEWIKITNNLDTDKIAKNLHEIGVGYYFITVMQGSKFMLAPNAVYDKITGYKPGEACAERDVIADLITSLDKYGIDLYLYYTGDGPHLDAQAGTALGFYDVDGMWYLGDDGDYHLKPADKRAMADESFVTNWAAVLEEYAVRYKDKVKGWWIDGCYDYSAYTDELMDIYKRAAKKGNPDALITFNNGTRTPLIKWGPSDYTAGEYNNFSLEPKERFSDGIQTHLLIPIGIDPQNSSQTLEDGVHKESIQAQWCCRGLFKTKEEIAEYVKKINSAGGVVTLDIFIDKDGSFDSEQIEALKFAGKYIK